MTKLNQVFKCGVCGNIVEVVHASGGELVCCGQPMTLQIENTVEASKEKHIPVIKKIEGGIHVNVGSVEHPMEEKHYIEFIEVIFGKKVMRKYLLPGDKPEACFKAKDLTLFDLPEEETSYCEGSKCNFECKNDCGETIELTVRAYCNLHGLWKA